MDRNPEVVAIMESLARPFPDAKVKWKPAVVQGNRALALAYIDARTVQDRLDEVLGPENWQSKFVRMENGAVACELSIRLAGEWITKSDVGGESEQPDGGDRVKAAYSDSLKRAAVQFGVGRFLYTLPKTFYPYDPVKRQFVNPPKLPQHLTKGGGNPPAQAAAKAADAKADSKATQTSSGNPPQHQKRTDAKADTPGNGPQAASRASQEQIERIDLLVERIHQKDSRRSPKWLSESISEKFGKTQTAELTDEEADKVIVGLESNAKKLGLTVVFGTPAATTETSGTSSAASSAGKTPARRGTF